MICEKCVSLFCRCFMSIHKRQLEGVKHKLLKDDKELIVTTDDRRAANRAYYARVRDARKNS